MSSSPLQKETKQRRPFESERQEAVVGLLRTASVVRRRFEALCQQHDLTLQQFNVLRILRGARRSGEGALPTMEVAARMIEPEPGITRLMGRLEAKSLISRERGGDDARRVLCHITPVGLKALKRLDKPMLALDNQSLGPLSVDDVRSLMDLLHRVRESGLNSI